MAANKTKRYTLYGDVVITVVNEFGEEETATITRRYTLTPNRLSEATPNRDGWRFFVTKENWTTNGRLYVSAIRPDHLVKPTAGCPKVDILFAEISYDLKQRVIGCAKFSKKDFALILHVLGKRG